VDEGGQLGSIQSLGDLDELVAARLDRLPVHAVVRLAQTEGDDVEFAAIVLFED